jgi:hypothetical protein
VIFMRNKIFTWTWRLAALGVLVGVALLYTRRDMVFELANFIAACF